MLGTIKASLKSLFKARHWSVRPPVRAEEFTCSSDYWEVRYKTGGNSGAGSYGRLAEFKADFLNRFVDEQHIESVIEFGCGDGAQLELSVYPSYTGVDVSAKAVDICRSKFKGDSSKRFLHLKDVAPGTVADLSLSLDVIYHLVEDSTFDAYMRQLFASARSFVIIYSSNVEEVWPARHVRHRKFTSWVEEDQPDWHLQSTLKNEYPYDPGDVEQTSFAEFYVFARR
jgi:hypothetical protein